MMEEDFRRKPCSFEHANRLRSIFIPRVKSQSQILLLEICMWSVLGFLFTCCSSKKKKRNFFFLCLQKQNNNFFFKIKFVSPSWSLCELLWKGISCKNQEMCHNWELLTLNDSSYSNLVESPNLHIFALARSPLKRLWLSVSNYELSVLCHISFWTSGHRILHL